MPMLASDLGDLFASRQGRASSGSADFGAIARDFGPKILRLRNKTKISVRIASKNQRSPARRSMPMLAKVFGDLFGSRQGRTPSSSANCDAISRDLGPRILRPHFFFRKFWSESRLDTRASGNPCLLYTSPSPRDRTRSRMPSSA